MHFFVRMFKPPNQQAGSLRYTRQTRFSGLFSLDAPMMTKYDWFETTPSRSMGFPVLVYTLFELFTLIRKTEKRRPFITNPYEIHSRCHA